VRGALEHAGNDVYTSVSEAVVACFCATPAFGCKSGTAEQHAGKQLSPSDHTRALVESVMGSDAIGFLIEAMTLTAARIDNRLSWSA
jgi:hypothetical protein